MSKNNHPEQYRNINDFHVNDDWYIDAGSLWNRVGDKLVLDDDDCYVETKLDLTIFEKIN